MLDEKFDVKSAVQAAIEKFRTDFKKKSYAQRHPELGKMMNCLICLTRHRSSVVCVQKFATGTHDPAPEGEKTLLVAAQTRKGILGSKQFKGKRVNPHHSHKLLRLVQLTQSLFPEYYPVKHEEPKKAMKAARRKALRLLIQVDNKIRKSARDMKSDSRRINRG